MRKEYPSANTSICSATTAIGQRLFPVLCVSIFCFPLAPTHFHGSCFATPFPQHVCIIFYPWACPRWSQLWGNGRSLPPAILLTKCARSCRHTQNTSTLKTCMYKLTMSCTHTDTLVYPLFTQHSGRNLISQRAYGIDFFSPPCFGLGKFWLGTVWLMWEHPQQNHGLSRLHFLGAGRPEGKKDPALFPSSPSFLFLFFPYPLSLASDSFICLWDLATMWLWLHVLAWTRT